MIFEKNPNKTPLSALSAKLFEQHKVKVWVKRDDLNHPQVQGNKWHKLKYNLQAALNSGKTQLLTFGGAYSNHIAATAAAANSMGMQSIGLIRGDELADAPEKWSPTLRQAQHNGMQLHFVSRKAYREKADPEYLQHLQADYPNAYILPEGGSNELAIQGFDQLMSDINQQCPDWHQIYTAVGTGGTLSGLVHCANQGAVANNDSHCKQIIGVPVLKQGDYLKPQIEQWLQQAQNVKEDVEKDVQQNTLRETQNSQLSEEQKQRVAKQSQVSWKLLTQYHDGGYGKQSEKGKQFQNEFEERFEILLDPVYTSKAFFAFFDQLQAGKIEPGSNIILLHTGGLQGRKNN